MKQASWNLSLWYISSEDEVYIGLEPAALLKNIPKQVFFLQILQKF